MWILTLKKIIKVQETKKKVVVVCSRPSENVKLDIAENVKKCTKKCDARAELLFCQSKPFAFLPFSSLLKLSVDNPEGGTVCNLTAGDKSSPHS